MILPKRSTRGVSAIPFTSNSSPNLKHDNEPATAKAPNVALEPLKNKATSTEVIDVDTVDSSMDIDDNTDATSTTASPLPTKRRRKKLTPVQLYALEKLAERSSSDMPDLEDRRLVATEVGL